MRYLKSIFMLLALALTAVSASAAQHGDINNDGEADKALEQISAHFDECMFGEYCGVACIYYISDVCIDAQKGIDLFAKLFASSGKLPPIDSLHENGLSYFFGCSSGWMGK